MSDNPLRRDADGLPDPTDTEALTRVSSDAALAAVVVSVDDGPDECTLYPLDVNDADLVTTWLSAEGASFVALAEMR
jgi:hypothetical protein